MNSKERKSDFKKWLIKDKRDNGGGLSWATRNSYMSAIKKLEEFLSTEKDFFSCGSSAEVDDIVKESWATFCEINGKRAGALNAVVEKYKEFLNIAPSFAAAVLHKAPQNIDITDYVTEGLLVNLFKKTFTAHFPGYELYTKAQGKNCKDYSVLLKNEEERKVLLVVLLPKFDNGKDNLFMKISADFEQLKGLFDKEKMEFSVRVVAGRFTDDFKSACKMIPSIKLSQYSLNALELHDVQ
ncbi:hypothetical protein [Treponema berlinense]|uniref:hypothetical protein n=1 Tax=Treponema berlinense TaxID=225004 RepID=UPI0026F1C56B|nr:hypothetical protein [Treponema berlinense]